MRWSFSKSTPCTPHWARPKLPASTTEACSIADSTHSESDGAWHFITRRHILNPDGSFSTLHSRLHRKALGGERLWTDVTRLRWRDLWLPSRLNWWIGVVFAVGAFLFALGAFASLFPVATGYWALGSEQINLIFFIGSVPFTTAAWLQLMQSANAGGLSTSGEVNTKRFRLFGWYPADAGWLSCALQFAGTLLFNINTFNALLPSANWLAQDLSIWLPDMFGSVFFLASGYLAFVETCHRHWAWMPHLLSWRITFVNLLGCIFFMVSAVCSFVPLRPMNFDTTAASLLFTLLGALAFFVGALLLLPEASSDAASAD